MNIKQKLCSRKFQVWIITTAFSAVALFDTKIETSTRDIIFNGYVYISIIYILGNAASAYINNRHDKPL